MTHTTIREMEIPDIGKHPESFWPLRELFPDVHAATISYLFGKPAPDLSDCLARTLPGRPWLLQLWEPLLTKAPSPARCQPYCCYIKTVIFYHRPYIRGPKSIARWRDGKVHVSEGGFAQFDQIETRLTWDDVVRFHGDEFVIGGGRVVWRNNRWWMMRTARRKAQIVAI